MAVPVYPYALSKRRLWDVIPLSHGFLLQNFLCEICFGGETKVGFTKTEAHHSDLGWAPSSVAPMCQCVTEAVPCTEGMLLVRLEVHELNNSRGKIFLPLVES